MRNLVAGLSLGFALLIGASAAQADSITLTSADVGSSFTVLYDGNVSTINIPDLTSKAVFTVASLTSNTLTLNVDVTMTASNGVAARLSGIGFNTAPDITGATSTGLFNLAVVGGSFPNGFGSIDVCFKDGGGPSCQGGGSGGTFTTGSFTVALNFGSPVTSVTLDNFGVRYQSITGVRQGDSGTGQGTIDPRIPLVPEPATWSLMILAFGVTALATRRRLVRA
jgi:hypothetical protein